MAQCTSNIAAACSFGYSWDVTPSIELALPGSGQSGDELLLLGASLDNVTRVEFLPALNQPSAGSCVTSGPPQLLDGKQGISCTVPPLPPGAYFLRVRLLPCMEPVGQLCRLHPEVSFPECKLRSATSCHSHGPITAKHGAVVTSYFLPHASAARAGQWREGC